MTTYNLRFLKDYSIKDETGTVIKAGEIITVDNEASRDRWLRRGVAEVVKGTAPKAASKKKSAKA